MDDLDMQLYEAAKEFKRRDFVASICNSYVLGHIEGFSKTYQKALRILGHDEDEIRKKTIISLFEQGFEQEYVSKVLNIEDHEWKELTKGHTADIKARKALYAEIHRKGIECMKEFDRTHPGYFDETGLVVCSEKTKKESANSLHRQSSTCVFRQPGRCKISYHSSPQMVTSFKSCQVL